MATEMIHHGIDDLYEVISRRNAIATVVVFIGTELSSFTASSVRGKKAFNNFLLGVVGVYDKKIMKKELEEDMRKTMEILHI